LFVGFDTACWEYLNPLLKLGRLPTIQRLIDYGSSGILESTLPALTPTAWSSIIIGKNPDKHSILDFILKQPKELELFPTVANLKLGTPFWHRLNEYGVQVGLVNVPFIYLFQTLDGYVVCGFETPVEADCVVYPKEASDIIYDHFPRFKPKVSI
jgi:predicted AlkP superfamily phosphohydrolase/phosphomutase